MGAEQLGVRAGLAAVGLAALSPGAEAAVFNVTNTNDAGVGSLRQAIEDANGVAGADSIEFDASVTGTITLTTGQLAITDSVQINGPGASTLSVSGNNASRVFYLYNGSAEIDVTIRDLTVTGGNDTNGGGIINLDENLTIDGLNISGNTASGDGGGLWADGFAMDLTITNTTISGNSGSNGGGIYIDDTGGPTLIQNSVISGNSAAGSGGGIFFYDPDDSLTVQGCVISGNTAGTVGGGIYTYDTDGGTHLLSTSTISGNSADAGGAMFLYGPDDPMTIENATISGNQATAGDGGGVFFYSLYAGFQMNHVTVASNSASGYGGGLFTFAATVSISNSIIGDNSAATDNDLASTKASFTLGNSLVESPGAASINDSGGNIFNQDAQLAALADNGGTTETHLPANTSPAINAGTGALASDQRGLARPVGAAVDMGAVEFTAGSVTLSTDAQSVGEEAGSVTITAQRTGGADGAVLVDIDTADVSAIAPGDYTAASASLNWASGESTDQTLAVTLIDDPDVEGPETFTATISNPAGGVALGATTVQTITITSGDLPPAVFNFNVAAQTVAETIGNATLTIQRSGDLTLPVSVTVSTLDMSATAGADYTAVNQVVNWGAGDGADKTVDLPILDDALVEIDETLQVSLSSPSQGAVLGVLPNQLVTITSNDVAGGPPIPVPVNRFWALLAAGFGMLGFGAWAINRRARTGLGIGLALISAASLTYAPSSLAARPAKQIVVGVVDSVRVENGDTTIALASGSAVSAPSDKVELKDSRRRASKVSGVEAVAAGTPVLLKTVFNDDGSVRKLKLRLFNSLADAERERAGK